MRELRSLTAEHPINMRYRRFRKTGLQMPVFTCGGMRYQQSWQDMDPATIPAENQANLEATILRALELGINHIETARGYGTSEIQLGKLLPTLPRDKMIVQTKVGPCDTAAEFLKTCDLSLRNLGLEFVDLLSIHGINDEKTYWQAMRPGGCLEAARQLQAQGRARHIGFSSHGSCYQIQRAIESGGFDYVNLHWYFVNHLNWPAVVAAHKLDMGVFIISPNDKGGKLYAPPDKLRQLCEPLSPMAFNNLYCLSRPEVHTLSVGAARPSDFDEHDCSLEHYDRAAEIIAPVEARLRDAMTSSLGADWCARWDEGLPEFWDIPGDINVKEICRLWTYAKGLDLVDFGKMRYNLLGTAGHWFPGQKAASFDSTAIVQACSGSPFADRLPDILREAHSLLDDAPKKRLSQS